MDYFLCVIGMVLILEGIPYFAFPDKMKSMMEKIQEMEDGALRGVGVMAMVVGLILVYIGRM